MVGNLVLRRCVSGAVKRNLRLCILMHLFIFSIEKMYYLHKTTSAVSRVKPNASQ